MEHTYTVPALPLPAHPRPNSARNFYPTVEQPTPLPSYPQPRVDHQPPQSSSAPRHPVPPQSRRGTPTQPYEGYDILHPNQAQSQQPRAQTLGHAPGNASHPRRASHYTPLQQYNVPDESPIDTSRPKHLPAPVSPVSLSTASPYTQFCNLVGIPAPPTNHPFYPAWKSTLYARATTSYRQKQWEYWLTGFIGNFLLLLQILISATVTALGATSSPHITVTVFGALGTVVAGIITYLKSRGQPMRARTFRNELGQCLGAIKDAEVMFLGVSEGVDGYDVEDGEGGNQGGQEVTVRAEVERLTAMYDAIVANAQNNYPDLWATPTDGAPTKMRQIARLFHQGVGANRLMKG